MFRVKDPASKIFVWTALWDGEVGEKEGTVPCPKPQKLGCRMASPKYNPNKLSTIGENIVIFRNGTVLKLDSGFEIGLQLLICAAQFRNCAGLRIVWDIIYVVFAVILR